MSGIPVYTQSPIHAAKASGTTPQTATPQAHSTPSAPRANTATTTATPTSPSANAAAQPGAPAVPAPTSAAQRYAPVQQLQPTPTTKTEDAGPAPPQPGAVPTPSSGMRSNIPPPPKVGETYHPPPQASQPQSYIPPQMGMSVPTQAFRAQPPSSSTSTTTMPSYAYPVALPQDAAPRRSLEHPPGYVQNPYASTFTSDQRRAQEAENNSSSGLGGFGSDNSSSNAAFGVNPEGLWNSAKAFAATAGRKLSEAETDIWKKINKE